MPVADNRRSPGRRREDQPLYRIVFPILIALALVALLVFGHQWFVTYREQARQAHLESTADWAVTTLSQSIGARRAALENAVQMPRVLQALALGDANAMNAAAAHIEQSFSTPRPAVALIPAGVDERDVAGYPGLDYAGLDLIWDFIAAGGQIPAEVHAPGSPQAHFVLIEPVLPADGQTLLGFVRASWPADAWYALLESAQVAEGYLGLTQGDGDLNDTELFHLGDAAARGRGAGQSVPVPGSRLHVAIGAVPGFALLNTRSRSVIWGGLILGGLLLIGVILLRHNLDKLQARALARRDRAELARQAQEEQPAGTAIPPPATTKPPPATTKPPAKPDISPTMFRAYDIRGVVGETLNPGVTKLIGQAIGSEARLRGTNEIVVARDGRLSGPELSQALSEGLCSSGCDVIDIGAAPTPVLYFATHYLNTQSGVMLTGSHNPPDYNGFKIMLGGETLAEDAIQELYRRIVEGRLEQGQGTLRQEAVTQDYIERISSDVQLQRPLKVVADAGNGIAGAIAPPLLKAVGAEVVPLYCEVDGAFPNHHPDPSVPENLRDLIERVKQERADLGLAFDGDGDRLGVVTPDGEIIYPDRLLSLFARDVLLRNPGAAIIFDVKCSARLTDQIVEWGGSPLMWKTGHSLIKAKLKETGALLAGEMSGHFFFTERWYGFDDGLYAACRLLEILAQEATPPGEVLAQLPGGVSTPELKVEMTEGEHFEFLERFKQQAGFEGAHITSIDGLRADFNDGWGLVRCSNTTPCLVLRFEGDDEAALQRVQEAFRRQLLAVKPDLELPF